MAAKYEKDPEFSLPTWLFQKSLLRSRTEWIGMIICSLLLSKEELYSLKCQSRGNIFGQTKLSVQAGITKVIWNVEQPSQEEREPFSSFEILKKPSPRTLELLGPRMRTWTGANVVFFLVVLGYPWCNCALRHAKLNKPPAGWGEKDNGLSWVGLLSELQLEQGVRGLGWHLQMGRQIMKLLGEWGAPGLAKLQKNDKRPKAESATPPSRQCFYPTAPSFSSRFRLSRDGERCRKSFAPGEVKHFAWW